MIGIHPGLHAEGVYEYWEPTLELLLDKNVKTAFTVLSEEEYVQVSDSGLVKEVQGGPSGRIVGLG